MPELRADYCFFIQISIELKIKACTQLIRLFRGLNEREFPKLSYDFCFCCLSPPLLSYNCSYVPRSVIRNH